MAELSYFPYSNVSTSNLLANPSFEEVTTASVPDGAYLNVPVDQASTYLTDTRQGCIQCYQFH